MKALVVSMSIASGMKEVLLRVQDLPSFAIGQEFNLTFTPIETAQELSPDNVVAMAADNSGTPSPDLKAEGTTAAPETIKPTPCPICNGSGIVSQFTEGQKTGEDSICELCKGTGIKPVTATV